MKPLSEYPLTPKQQLFCDEYLTSFNATQAALRAGYSVHTAMSGKLMQLAKIAAHIKQRSSQMVSSLGITQRDIFDELYSVAFSSMGFCFDAAGNVKPVHKMHEREQAAIWNISITENKDGEKTTKVRFYNKLVALEKMARMMGMYQNNLQGPEVKHVYVDQKQMDQDDRFEDNSFDADDKAKENARLAEKKAIADQKKHLKLQMKALKKREQELAKRENGLNGAMPKATVDELVGKARQEAIEETQSQMCAQHANEWQQMLAMMKAKKKEEEQAKLLGIPFGKNRDRNDQSYVNG